MSSGMQIARRPGQAITKPIKKRLEKRGWKHRALDITLISLLAVIAIAGVIWLLQADPGRRVQFTAVVAPEQVVSGGNSTLSISYNNKSNKTLEDVTLSLTYPPYFVLQDVEHTGFEAETNTIELGTLAPGANGLLKIRGVMFGNVGGEQTFGSTLAYSWDGRFGTREQLYRFSPASSALTIETQLPDRLVSGQRIAGTVLLRNDGPVTFPEASIHAVFPDGFTLRSTSLAQREDETWIVPSIEPSEELVIDYAGDLARGDNDEATFLFEPSFVFGNERFTQDTLSETVATVPPPISVVLSGVPEAVSIGEQISAIVSWSQQTDLNITDARIRVEGATNEPTWNIDTPVVDGSREVTLIPRRGSGTNRTVTFVPIVEFTLDNNAEPVQVVGTSTEARISTSVDLNGFTRYFTPAGDQLGRGPLSPQAGEQTIYWAVINIQGTFNDMTDVVVTADLPGNVSWINRQSVTKGSGVTSNGSSIRWNLGALDATASNGTIAAASFALGITPSGNQVGSVPPLLRNIRVTGRDVWTGETVTRSIGSITTQTAEDSGLVQ